MKRIFNIRSFIFILILPFQFSCGGPSESGTTDAAHEQGFEGFENFPAQQYYEIQLGQSFELAQKSLLGNQFEILEENESVHFRRDSDSTEVILSSNPTISNFRIFLRSSSFLAKKDDFLMFFEENASKTDKNTSFSVLSFAMVDESFQLTIFEYEDYLRLEFEI